MHSSLDNNDGESIPSITKQQNSSRNIVPPLKLSSAVSRGQSRESSRSKPSMQQFFTDTPEEEDRKLDDLILDNDEDDYFMDSDTFKHHQTQSSVFSSISNFKPPSATQPLRGISQYSQQDPLYVEGLDVFDEFEQKFNDFLRSTPYIDQIL